MKVSEILEKRVKLVADARALLDKAENEKRAPTAEEREQFDKMMADADAMKAEADSVAKLEAAEKELADSRGRKTPLEVAGSPAPAAEKRSVETRGGKIEWTETAESKAYADAFNRAMSGSREEIRALQKDSDTAGGYLSAPQQFQAELIKALDNSVFMRQICRVLPPLATAESLGAPSLDADPADPTWTTELAVGDEDTTMAFGKRELKPHPLAQYIKVSKTLLRRSALGAEALVRDRLAYKCAVVEENAFMNGTGNLQPLGIFVASANGINTDRDVSTGNTDSEIRTDGLLEAEGLLPAQYRPGCSWVFHREAVTMIRKLKDGNGQYLWQPSVVAGQPDRLFTYPVYISEYAPHTFTTTCYVGMLGNFQQYWIVDALTMQIQVLVELYAATNQNGYISRLECDGMPVLSSAFARVKLA